MPRLVRSLIHNSAVFSILAFPSLLAQSPSGQPAVATADKKIHWCWRGRPKPTCDVFWLTEFSAALPVPYEGGSLYTGEVGSMMNRGKRLAFGVAGFFQGIGGAGEGGIGIRPRLRWWMSPDISVDVAPGIVWHGSGTRPGFSGHAALNVGDVFALTAHVVERVPSLPYYEYEGETRGGVFLGVRAGYAVGALILVCLVVFAATLPDT